jgi:diguanylate cyclase (GGDEF)-like protein
MVDLDYFKATNDRYGHVVGDEVLRAVGEILRSAIRETDCVARFGGDEFMVVLPDTPAEGARMVAERILERAAATAVNGAAGKVPIKLSVGCGTLPPLSTGPNFNLLRPNMIERAATLLLEAADKSLYATKHSGVAGEPREIAWSDLLTADAAAA